MSGSFITFEGGEGSGKTTQIKLLHAALVKAGKSCVVTREPGGSPSAEAIRSLLLTGSADKWHPVAEMLLFQAARMEHAEQVIKPALVRGDMVLCDRFLDSTVVYQGIGKDMGVEYIRSFHRLTLGTLMPGLTFILDIDPREGLRRAKGRAGDETRFENMDIAFHHRIRDGFLTIAKSEPERCVVIDASGEVEDVRQTIYDALIKHYLIETVPRLGGFLNPERA